MNKFLVLLCGIIVAIILLIIIGAGAVYNNMLLTGIGAFFIGVICTRWIGLEWGD